MSREGQPTTSHNRHNRALRRRNLTLAKYIDESAYQELLIVFGLAGNDARQARCMGLRTWSGGAQW